MGKYILSKSDARELLNPYAQEFYLAIRNGFSRFESSQAADPVEYNHTKAIVIWDYTIQNIKRVVNKYKDKLRFETKQRMVFIVIEDKIAVKFKKFDDNCKSGNIETNQVGDFRNHMFKHDSMQLFPIEIGWQVDEFYSLSKVDFISPNGDGYLWRIQFRELGKEYNEIFVQDEEYIQTVTLKTDNDNAKTAS